MKSPILVRRITDEERKELETGLRSPNATLLRRCQILLASARGQHASTIEKNIGCDDETVRKVIKAFNGEGLKGLEVKSRRPHRTMAAFTTEKIERLKELLYVR